MRHKLAVLLAAALMALAMGGTALAQPPPFECRNPGGNTPQGQCQGQALQTVNPAGHAPPGHN